MNDELHEMIRRELEAYDPRQEEIQPKQIPDPDNMLTGIKEISTYLGTRLGRSVGEQGGWVVARKDELDAWLSGGR